MSDFHIPYGRQEITQDDINAVIETLNSDFLTQGPSILEFEKKFAKYVDAQYAVAVSNGTAALHLCTLALNVNENSRVITSPITFAASANCVRYCGGVVDFVDINPHTYLLDIEKLSKKLAESPPETYAGIIPVDFTGMPCNMEALRELADQYNLWVIEDACHAPGAHFVDSRGERQKIGNGKFSDMTVFSFHPVKHIACGEGGMITTNEKEFYERLKALRTHGIVKNDVQDNGGWYYEMMDLGYNYRLTDIQASLGLSQLARADSGIDRRHQIAAKYDLAFEAYGIRKQVIDDKYQNAFHLYVIEVDKRKELYDYLHDCGILAQVHYIPAHLLPYYKQFGWKNGDLPNAEAYYKRCLSLPMFPSLTNEEQEHVITTVLKFINGH